MTARGITIIGASAGSGKTYRLTQEVTRAIDPASADRVALEGLVAVTFTRKAHAELAGRIRQKLVEKQAYDDAMRLPLAYLGTVHAACLRLLQEFALDAGLSPNVDVVAEDPALLLRKALESALPAELRERLEQLATATELRIDQMRHRTDWHTPVFDIMELARSNRIGADRLPEMAARSAKSLLALLPKPVGNGEALDTELARQLDAALSNLTRLNDTTKATKEVIQTIRDAKRRLADRELPWSFWVKLSKLEPAKASKDAVAALREAANVYATHPRLHREIQELTESIFQAARIGLSAYQHWKEQRRVVDYVDMLDRAHDLLDNERVRSELGRRLQLVVVDEFQDTSPIQLALFVRLHELAKRSIWVGDRKQCIFEYAGADPLLMDTVAAWVEVSGGTRDRLAGNYRSRVELVDTCSELFATALARHGFTRDEVVVEARRDSKLDAATTAELQKLPPLGLWFLDGSNATADAEAIADGVRRMLVEPGATPVLDRTSKAARPVRPVDIAVLVTTNAAASLVAGALHARGIRAAIARAGLLSTPEGTLVDAALRWVHDPGDTLAAATIDTLRGYDGRTPDEWLEQHIRDLRRQAAVKDGAAEPESTPTLPSGWRAELTEMREGLDVLSPAEALDGVLAATDAVHLCARWPDAPQRIANLDALRTLAKQYEERCAQQREAATIAGLLRHFDDLREERLQRNEMIASDDQHVPTDDGAVVVCTYHKSKGLEWPVVVLGSLDKDARRHAFEVTPESDNDAFTPSDPLAGRWIRYWPWLFGGLETVPLRDEAEQTEEGKRVAKREERERTRLLYVGFTRARDHLVLAIRRKVTRKDGPKLEKKWLDILVDGEGSPIVGLPVDAADGATAPTTVRKTDGTFANVATRVFHVSGQRPEAEDADRAAPKWFARAEGPELARPPYRIVPSTDAMEWPELDAAVASASVGGLERLPKGITVEDRNYDYDVLGTAVHDFLAADVDGLRPEERTERARRLVDGAGMTGVVRPEALVRAGDQLRAWADAKFPGAIWRREVPIEAVVASPASERRVVGIIDLLLETPEGDVIVDHKTFPADNDAALRKRAGEYLPQLVAYAMALEANGRTVRGAYVHFPVGGAVVQCLLEERVSPAPQNDQHPSCL